MNKNFSVQDLSANDCQKPDDGDLWRTLMANADIAITVCREELNGDFRIVDVNAACQPFARDDWSTGRGRLMRDVVVPQMAEYVIPKFSQCINSGSPQSYERVVDFPSGRKAWAINLIPLKARKGEPRFVIEIVRPISVTDYKLQITDDIPSETSLIYIYNGKSRRITFAGGKVDELLGLRPKELEELSDPLETLAHPDDLAQLRQELEGLSQGHVECGATFACRLRHANGEYRRILFHGHILQPRDDGGWHMIGLGSDVTERDQLKAEVAHLNNELASAQLTERRLIAQELHDSAGQQIVAAKLALAVANERCVRLNTDESIFRSLQDVKSCLEDAEHEIRVLSYLLHPPPFSGQDLAAALTNFSMGFGGRTGLSMDVSIDTKINQHGAKLSRPLLRVFQESLTNVHRHAHAKSVRVRLDVVDCLVELEIVDDGVGIDRSDHTEPSYNGGLGLINMQERINELGGTLLINGDDGTRLTASIPIN